MSVITNGELVHNQVGGAQNVHGSVYHGPVTNVTTYTGGGQPLVADPDDHKSDHDAAVYDNEIIRRLAFPHMFERRSTIEPPHRNTCRWILDTAQFQQWDAQPQGLLWVKGKPGAGKSTLMSFLYDRSKSLRSSDGIYLDFFFSARGGEMQRTPLGMFRALLNQIFCQDTDARHVIRTSYEEEYRAAGRMLDHGWHWPRQSLEILLMQTLLLSTRRRQVTIFIDALDEAGERNARDVARYFHRVNDNVVGGSAAVKVCISSRHYPIPSTIPGLEVWVESHNTNDITTFVHDRLGLDYRTSYDTPDLERWYDLKAEIVQRAKGIFQWVHLVVPFLEQYLDDGDAIEDAQERIKEVPNELKGVYEYIIREVIGPRHRLQSFRLFQWICLAERPLSVDELRYAMVALDAEVSVPCHSQHNFVKTNTLMKARIRALSGGIIEVIKDPSEEFIMEMEKSNDSAGTDPVDVIDPSDTRNDADQDQGIGSMLVQVIHQSANDFLRSEGFALLAALQSKPLETFSTTLATSHTQLANEGHAMMYWSCLNYISSEDAIGSFEVGFDFRDLSYDWTEQRERTRASSPFAFYAANYLFTHGRKASVSRSRNIQKQIKLLRLILRRWVFAQNVSHETNDPNPAPDWTLLHAVAAGGMLDVAQTLVEQGEAGIHQACLYGQTPLHVAAEHGHADMVDLLVKSGADLHLRASAGRTPLTYAAEKGQLEVMKTLLSAGAGVENRKAPAEANRYSHDRAFPLQAAAFKGDVAAVQLLLDNGADPNLQGDQYGSPLASACSGGSAQCVRLLLDAGARVNISSPMRSRPALQEACSRGHKHIVNLLISEGADVNEIGGRYGNALQATLLASAPEKELVQVLLDAGADVNAHTAKYGTALHAAVVSYAGFPSEMELKVFEMLLDAGADVNAQGGKYGNALQAALRLEQHELAAFLVSHGAHDMYECAADFYSNLHMWAVRDGGEACNGSMGQEASLNNV